MKIIEVIKEEYGNYENLVINHGTIFNSITWLNLFKDKIKIYGFYDNGGALIGGFHLYKEKKYMLSLYRNSPFTPFIGPFFNYETTKYVSQLDFQKEVLSLMADFFDDLNFSILSVSFNRKIIDTQALIWRKYNVTPKYTYILDLNLSENDLWDNFASEKRNDIRKAAKDELTINRIDDYQIVQKLVLKTFLRKNKAIDRAILDNILFIFANESNSFAFVCNKGKTTLAVCFCIYDKTTAYYLLSGYDAQNKHHGAGPMAMWEAIKYSQKIGLKEFDFEGSMIP